MSEPEEEMNFIFRSKPKDFVHPPPATAAAAQQQQHAVGENHRDSLMMDLDLDLDASWSFDQIFAAAASASNPMSPFLVSAASEQPCSPLWAFSDENEDKPNGNALSTGSLRLSNYPRFVTCKLRAYTCCFQLFWNYV